MSVGGGDAGRDDGIERVSAKNKEWLGRYMRLLPQIPVGTVLTAEDIRLVLTDFIGHPTSPNAWGAAANSAARSHGLLRKTGNYRKPKATKSHSRMIQEYVRV
jgi:hypothetical protein